MQERLNGASISADDDGNLVVRVRSGDLDAYAELMRTHAPMALRTARLLGAGPESEDVVQEAFVKAYRSLGRFRETAPFRPWLLRIVANETRNQHRSRERRRGRELAATLRSPDGLGVGLMEDPAEQVQRRGQREVVLEAVRALPARLGAVVTCRYLLDLDESETATVLGIPRGTVKSRLSRALARLREVLPEEPAGQTVGGGAGDAST